MLEQRRHKRFITTGKNDMLLSFQCYRCTQSIMSIVPVGNEDDNLYQRPDHIHT